MSDWLAGDAPRDERETAFLGLLREAAPSWAQFGVAPTSTVVLTPMVPLVAQIDLGQGHLRYLECGLWPPGSQSGLECERGEGHLLDNGGPDGTYVPLPDLGAVEAAELAIAWFAARLSALASNLPPDAGPDLEPLPPVSVPNGWFPGTVPDEEHQQVFHAALAQKASALETLGFRLGESRAEVGKDGSLQLSVSMPWLGAGAPQLSVHFRPPSRTDQNLTGIWHLANSARAAHPLLQVGGFALPSEQAADLAFRWICASALTPVRVELWRNRAGQLTAGRWTQLAGSEATVTSGRRVSRMTRATDVVICESPHTGSPPPS